MEHMMMESNVPMVFGMMFEVFLMMAAGVFYILCAAYVWKPMRQEKNELIGALFVFLIYQAISMFFMGLEMHTMNMVYSNIAGLAVFVGSAYMLKFPLSSLSERTRKTVFRVVLMMVVALFIWFIKTKEREIQLMHFTLWYDLVVNGLIVGGFIIFKAIGIANRWQKIKALGGGSGVVTCCVIANGAMITGAMITSSIFGFLAPVIIISTLMYARKKQREAPSATI
ncbi:MAG: hypothetical protein EXS50_03525 [Candidatus Taylorbacteria bacterium]|nr:hypothetical protein [Candidatus Taylorbacteria bacterium]